METPTQSYSLTFGGIFLAVAVPLLVQFGFSDSCSNEILNKLLPILGSLPGLVAAAYGRYRLGGVSLLGFRKN